MAIDFEDEDGQTTIVRDSAPFIVLEDTPMNKLHFLFIMLNISQVNIISQGAITGIITKLEFLRKRKEEAEIMRQERRRIRIMHKLSAGVGALTQFGSALGFGRSHTASHNVAAPIPAPSANSVSAEQREKLLQPS